MPPSDKRDALKQALERALERAKEVSDQPDSKTREEEEDLNREQQRALIRGLLQDIQERKKYATYFFFFACCWLAIIAGIVLLDGFGSFWFGKFPFRLSERVVLAMIGSTTVNVLGILYVVANYLFPKK
jgi:hypothetical protein